MSVLPKFSAAPSTAVFDPEGWDRCELGVDAKGWPKALPGFVKVTRASTEITVDKKKKKGAKETRPTFGGNDPQPVELELKMIRDIDREDFDEHCRRIHPSATSEPQYFDHPSVRHLRIKAIKITKIHHHVVVGPGVTTTKIEGLHWTPPPKESKNVTSTPARHQIKGGIKPETANPTPSKQEKIVESGSVTGFGTVLAN